MNPIHSSRSTYRADIWVFVAALSVALTGSVLGVIYPSLYWLAVLALGAGLGATWIAIQKPMSRCFPYFGCYCAVEGLTEAYLYYMRTGHISWVWLLLGLIALAVELALLLAYIAHWMAYRHQLENHTPKAKEAYEF